MNTRSAVNPRHGDCKSLAFASIIVASDTAERRQELRWRLELEGHQVAEVSTANQIVLAGCSGQHDVLLLDGSLEGMEPYCFCKTIRAKSDLGIIILDRVGTGQAAIDALNAGADDHLPVPFIFAELMARVRAILRRRRRACGQPCELCSMVLQDRTIDFSSHEVRGPAARVSRLTPKEFMVLQHLVTHANQSRTHRDLARAVWQRDGIGDVEYIRVVVKQLRRKLEPKPDSPRYILTERSIGYRFQTSALATELGTGRRVC